nr:hypothetical protein [Nannocystis sp.]
MDHMLFGLALRVALADVTPKKPYLSELSENLDPAVFADLKKWLAARAPSKPRSRAKP